ncbi:MAG: hypothetical protein AAF218_05820 [Pseudomonadota bacterium]
MTRTLAVLALITLCGCGADGEPLQPSIAADVSVTPSGIGFGAGLGLRMGPVALKMGLS